ncbi:MAG: LytTR family transcriptional regulator [Gammaproteobacteria bacterium]|nr:LytTR family transcriptional regulator [Gammaproteobacteria bacterium]MCP4277688.1 LytTR family transcriptional regulator [Gammaproteobacteria bacterium]
MDSISANDTKSISDNNTQPTSATSIRRNPVWSDYLLFFLGIPVAVAFIFSLVETKLTNGMPYLDNLLCINILMLTAWLPVCLSTYIIKFSFRDWRPPLIAVCLLGLFTALMPTAFLFQKLGNLYAQIYPIYAINRADDISPNWGLDYLLHFIRYSIPILPTFLAGVYGYRAVMGIDWFGYESPHQYIANKNTTMMQPDEQKTIQATANLIAGSKLADNAKILAIRADQHYIKIWSDQGTDLVRLRFQDLTQALKDCNGIQVHRSWWVNLDQVNAYKQDGRKLEVIMNDNLIIPVSLSYKNAVLNVLDKKLQD